MKKNKVEQSAHKDKNKKIELYNRYYGKIYLESISENEYQLTGPDNIYSYMRIGYKNLGNGNPDYTDIQFIDPDGGPYISVGSNIGTYNEVITNITCIKVENKYVYIIKTKKDDQC